MKSNFIEVVILVGTAVWVNAAAIDARRLALLKLLSLHLPGKFWCSVLCPVIADWAQTPARVLLHFIGVTVHVSVAVIMVPGLISFFSLLLLFPSKSL